MAKFIAKLAISWRFSRNSHIIRTLLLTRIFQLAQQSNRGLYREFLSVIEKDNTKSASFLTINTYYNVNLTKHIYLQQAIFILWVSKNRTINTTNFIIQYTQNSPVLYNIINFIIIIDNEDDQLISCSRDKTIKIWMKQKDNNQWKCVQTLIGHNIQVFFMSLNSDCNQLASTGYDGLRIWNRESDKVWKLYQLINNPNNDYFLRIKYISNNELIVSTINQGRLIRFIKNNSGLYDIQSQLQLNSLKEEQQCLFPIIYNQQLGLVLLRHSEHIYILKKRNNREFIIHQILKGKYASGYLTKDGRICILHEQNKNQHEIWKNQ